MIPARAREPRSPRRPRPIRAAWWSAAGLCAAAILYLSVIPVPEGPEIPWLDKAVHLVQYLALAWLLVQALRAGRLEDGPYLWLAWIEATSYGLLIELLQVLLPWRSADLLDAAANALGAAAGVWLTTRDRTARDR
ncbi:MAG: VanZ family protein [Candidatus Omnitrophica bacterium]|nr:VanZ family protein [Candidatus Omnitrophota bacterium]